jgi:hypothetical protein
MNQYAFLALELANDRVREAARKSRYFANDDLAEPTPGIARRSLARVAAAVSRGSADVARRLDASTAADDADCECVPA